MWLFVQYSIKLYAYLLQTWYLETSAWNIKTWEPLLWLGAGDFGQDINLGLVKIQLPLIENNSESGLLLDATSQFLSAIDWNPGQRGARLCFQIPVRKWEGRGCRGVRTETSAVPGCRSPAVWVGGTVSSGTRGGVTMRAALLRVANSILPLL